MTIGVRRAWTFLIVCVSFAILFCTAVVLAKIRNLSMDRPVNCFEVDSAQRMFDDLGETQTLYSCYC